jgi:hypothetical protein
MKKNVWINVWVIVLVAVSVAVLTAVLAKKDRQIVQLKEQLASATAAAEQAKQQLASASKNRRQTESLPAGSPVESVPSPASTQAAIPQAGTGAPTNHFAAMAGMMKNPQMKEVIRMQQKMVLDQMYGPMLKNLNRPENEVGALEDLLLQRQMAMVEAGMSAMSGSEADRKQSAEEIKTLKADYDKKIKDMLGPQDYEVFQQYELVAPERMQLQMFKGSLPSDAALTEQQESDLIAAMYEERKALPPSSLVNNQTPDPSQMTEERIAEALKQMEQLQQRYAQRAEAILTPAQLEQFTKWQQQMSAMGAAGLKMAAQMYGNKSAPQPPAANQGQTP